MEMLESGVKRGKDAIESLLALEVFLRRHHREPVIVDTDLLDHLAFNQTDLVLWLD